MSLGHDLEAAGRRAAIRPVPTPPPLSELQVAADRQKSKRRAIGSGVAAVALVVVGLPVALTMRGSTGTQSVVAGTGEVAPAAQTLDPAETDSNGSDPGPAAALQDPRGERQGTTSTEDRVRIEISNGADGVSFSVRSVTGDDAAAEADAAATAADETLEVDGVTVWISASGDERTVAALIDPDRFVEVTGDADQLDKLIELARRGGDGLHPFSGFDGEPWPGFLDDDGRFGNLEDLERFLEEGFPGFGDLEDLDPDMSDLDEFFQGGFPGLDEFSDGRIERGEFPEFDRLLDEFFADRFGPGSIPEPAPPGSLPDLDEFLGELPRIRTFFGEGFDGCVSISGERDGETFDFQFPEDCATG